MIGGLIQICNFGESARSDFKAGRGSLWALVPPIEALQIQEAGLDPVGLRSLSVPLVLRGRHALHHLKEEQPEGVPDILLELEFLSGYLLSSLVDGGDQPGSSAQRRLELLLEAIRSRSNPAAAGDTSSGPIDIPTRKEKESRLKKAKKKKKKRKEQRRAEFFDNGNEEVSAGELIQQRAKEARSRGSFHRVIVGLVLIPLLVVLYQILPTPGGGLPAASSYSSIPVVALIRHSGHVRARVHGSWFTLPDEERDVAVMILWDELVDETEDPGLELTVADHTNSTRGGVVAGKVWWRSY